MKTKQDHYDRISQRFSMLSWKVDWESKIHFMQNIIDEHVWFYTSQWFSIEEAHILIETPDRVRDFFGLNITCELRKLYLKGKKQDFFQWINNFFWTTDKVLDAFTLEALFEQMKSVKSVKDVQIWVKDSIMGLFWKNPQENKKKINIILWEISFFYFKQERESEGIVSVEADSVIEKINEVGWISSLKE